MRPYCAVTRWCWKLSATPALDDFLSVHIPCCSCNPNYGRHTVEQLVQLAQQSSSNHLTTPAPQHPSRFVDQLEHTQTNLAQLEKELDKLLETDNAVKSLKGAPEFGRWTVAVLRAELGDVTR